MEVQLLQSIQEQRKVPGFPPPDTSLVPKSTQKPTSKRTCRYSQSHIPDPEVGREGQRVDGTAAKRASMLPVFNFTKRTKDEG